MPALGIDIGGSSVKVTMLDHGEAKLARSESYRQPDREKLASAIRVAVDQLETQIKASLPIGLCLPGRQNASGECVEHAVNLPCLEGWVFNDLLRTALGFEPSAISIVSDIHAASIDLMHTLQLSGRSAVVAIGTGVGLGVLEDGRMLSIGSGGIGHIGQIDVGRLDEQDHIAPDGALNTLESYIGLTALRARFGELSEAELAERLESLSADDPIIRALVQALRIVHAIYRPDSIVLAGGIGIVLPRNQGLIYSKVNDRLTKLARSGWSLQFGDSLHHAASGAARLALG